MLGDLCTTVAFEPLLNGGIINIGAWGGTVEVSKALKIKGEIRRATRRAEYSWIPYQVRNNNNLSGFRRHFFRYGVFDKWFK